MHKESTPHKVSKSISILGLPESFPDTVAKLREAKVSWRNITNILNAEKVPAPSGKVWHTTSVIRVAKGEA
jgi:hypothetical protein